MTCPQIRRRQPRHVLDHSTLSTECSARDDSGKPRCCASNRRAHSTIPPLLCTGAARLDNGSVVTLGQPFVGVMSAAGGAMTLNAGMLPLPGPSISPPGGPILKPAAGLEGGRLHFSFDASPGQNYEVWASTNLVEWTVIGTGTANGPTVQFEDADTAEHPWRFYRVRLP